MSWTPKWNRAISRETARQRESEQKNRTFNREIGYWIMENVIKLLSCSDMASQYAFLSIVLINVID